MNYIFKSLKDVIEYEGRSSITESRYFFVFNFIILLIALSIDISLGLKREIVPGLSSYFLTDTIRIILIFPNLSLGVRRLHDINKSGLWVLLSFTIIGFLPLFYWYYFIKGDDQPNQYGDKPIEF
tara:strand:- start:143 stop:517 length:375 start_codon:yes stop_codon:yes gene_type:complete